MSKASEAQWPESSSEDDFASQKSTKKMIKKASLATSARKRKQNRSTEVIGSKALTITDSCGEDLDIVATIALTKANSISLPPGIRSASDLKWWYEDGRYYPCRICDSAEAMHVNLDPIWDTTELALIQSLEYPPTKPFSGRDRVLANISDLQNFGSGETWDKSIWKAYNQQRVLEARRTNQRALSQTDVQAGYLYLNRILKAAKEKDVIPEPMINNDDMSDLETPYEVNLSLSTTAALGYDDFSDRINEPLRPGDVIQYSSPIFCAGDPRGLRTATVISTDPTSTGFMIRLDNTEMLPNEHMVKRIKVIENGKLYDHNGFYRQINRFSLKKRALDVDAKQLYIRQSERVGRIVDKHIAKFRASSKAKGLPKDILPDFKSRRKLKADDELQNALTRKKESKKVTIQVQHPPFNCIIDDVEFQVSKPNIASSQPMKEGTMNISLSNVQNQGSSSSSDSDDSLEFVTPIATAKSGLVAKYNKACMSPLGSFDSKLTSRTKTLLGSKLRPESTKLVASKIGRSHTAGEINSPLKNETVNRTGLSETIAALLKKNSVSPKRKLNPMIHDESDSESSMENYGLNSAVKTRGEQESAMNCNYSDTEVFDVRRNAKAPSEKSLTINFDHKVERLLTKRRRYLPDKSNQLTHVAFSKVQSKKGTRPTEQSTMKVSVSNDKAPAPSTRVRKKHVARMLNLCESSDEGGTYRKSQPENFTEWAEETLVGEKDGGMNRSCNLLKDCNGTNLRTNDKARRYLHRIKRKGRYVVEEDDIEESGDEIRDSRQDRQIPNATKKRGYHSVVEMSSGHKI